MKHKHKEAFCHMKYAAQTADGRKYIEVTIWNSRDGVTPFCFISKEFGIELVHVNWERDVYDPNYVPQPGDLIWRNYTEEEARHAAFKERIAYDKIISNTPLEKLEEPPYRAMCETLSDIKKHTEETIKALIGSNQPKLDMIKKQ